MSEAIPMNYSTTPKWTIRRFLAERDGWKCQICEKILSPNARWGYDNPDWWTDDFPIIDHIKPRNNSPGISKIKLDDIYNLRLVCVRCNFCRFALDARNEFPEIVKVVIPQLKKSQFIWKSDPYKIIEGSSLSVKWKWRSRKKEIRVINLGWWKQMKFHFYRKVL